MTRLTTAVLAMGLSLAALGDSEPDKLVKLRDAWNGAKDREARPIKEKYYNALLSLRKQLTQQGNLGKALLVRDEIERLTGVAEPSESEEEPTRPPEVERLRTVYERDLAEMEKNFDAKYVTALRNLEKGYRKEDALNHAIAVSKEIEKLVPPEEDPGPRTLAQVVPFQKWLETVMFRVEDGSCRYMSGRTMAHTNAEGELRSSVKPRIIDKNNIRRTITWKYGSGTKVTITVDPDRTKATWSDSKGNKGTCEVVPRPREEEAP